MLRPAPERGEIRNSNSKDCATQNTFGTRPMKHLLQSLKLLAVQPDHGNNLYLAERNIRDFMARIPTKDRARTLASIRSGITDLMQNDPRTKLLLEGVNDYLNRLESD